MVGKGWPSPYKRLMLTRLTTLECSHSLSLELAQVFSQNMPRVMILTDHNQQSLSTGQ